MEQISQIRETSTGTDEYGLPIVTIETFTVSAIVAPRTSSKTVGSSEVTVTEDLALYLPPGTVVLPKDVFDVRGKRYLVDGEPFEWRSPFGGWTPGVVVDLRKAENV